MEDKKKVKLSSKEKEKLRKLLASADSESSEEENNSDVSLSEKKNKKNKKQSSNSLSDISDSEGEEAYGKKGKQQKQKNNEGGIKHGVKKDGQYLFDLLDEKKKIVVSNFKNQTFIALREYYEKNGEYLPTKKGCTIKKNQWDHLKKIINEIDQAIDKI